MAIKKFLAREVRRRLFTPDGMSRVRPIGHELKVLKRRAGQKLIPILPRRKLKPMGIPPTKVR